ncbi:alpha/beta hydrolase [Chitinophaga sancti]|uniref:alpha/beta fold hydrolase n=1 Tax=Chitinophaga sancti TaxID=1004 RepID=UPI002A7569D2|nr:alpha/beta hydrolase [Chitinophaga sancti]WPQ61680.1 alpha/beta hydrolase [Chitinophaga sancti]
MNNWKSATCNANNINIHYTRTGGNKSPVILLHGLMTNGLCWTDLARKLEKDYDVIMPDARGHGQSDVPDEGYQYEDLANDVAGLIHALELRLPFLIGHSMGGMMAAVVASRKPDLIKRVVLADPPFINLKVQQDVWDSDVAGQHRKVLQLPLEAVIADVRARHPHRSAETIALFAKARLQTSIAAFEVLRPPYPDYKILVSKIDIPALLVFGDRGVVTMDVAKELQGLQVKQIADAGHSLHMDQPERFADIIQTFLL